jgi:RNA polymerase sigma-70 factor (ECF subfamily)
MGLAVRTQEAAGRDEARILVEAQADHLVMLAVRDGDVEQIAVLFDRHNRALFNFFLRLTGSPSMSEDLVQEVFFRMLKYRQTYQLKGTFTAWMYQVARNAHLDLTRKRRLEIVPDEEPAWDELASADVGPLERLEQAQEIRMLRRALSRLPLEKREVLVLSRFQNLKYDEIAQILKCEVGAVKVRVYRAVRELGEIFSELSGEKAS